MKKGKQESWTATQLAGLLTEEAGKADGTWRYLGPQEMKARRKKEQSSIDAQRLAPSGTWEAFVREPGESDYKGCGKWTLRWYPAPTPTSIAEDDEWQGLDLDRACGIMFYGGETREAMEATCAHVEGWLAAGLSIDHAAALLNPCAVHDAAEDSTEYLSDTWNTYQDASVAFRALHLVALDEGPADWQRKVRFPAPTHAVACRDERLWWVCREAFLAGEEEDPTEPGPIWHAYHLRDAQLLSVARYEREDALNAEWQANEARLDREYPQRVANRKHLARIANSVGDPETACKDDEHLCLGCGAIIRDGEGFDATGEFCSEACLDSWQDEEEENEALREAALPPEPPPVRREYPTTHKPSQLALF